VTESELPQGLVRWHPEINLLAIRQLDNPKQRGEISPTESRYEPGWLMIGRGGYFTNGTTFYSDDYIAEQAARAERGEIEYGETDDRPCQPARWGSAEDDNLRTIDEFVTVFDPRDWMRTMPAKPKA